MNIVIENLNGTYDVTQLFGEISSLSYEKVIMDITALNNYTDINTLKSLISFIKPENLILVISKDNVPDEYLNSEEKLIS